MKNKEIKKVMKASVDAGCGKMKEGKTIEMSAPKKKKGYLMISKNK